MGRSKATTRRNARKCNSMNRDEGAEEPPVCQGDNKKAYGAAGGSPPGRKGWKASMRLIGRVWLIWLIALSSGCSEEPLKAFEQNHVMEGAPQENHLGGAVLAGLVNEDQERNAT